jgi:hypothetical protein
LVWPAIAPDDPDDVPDGCPAERRPHRLQRDAQSGGLVGRLADLADDRRDRVPVVEVLPQLCGRERAAAGVRRESSRKERT